MSGKTPEQLAQEAAEKAEAKAKAKAEREAARAKAKEERAAARAKAKADAKAAREASRQPAQNGIRRPKADTLCGKAWAVFDAVSTEKGSAAAIGECLPKTREQGLNDGNVRAEYARWRKFHGVSGRLEAPAKQKAAQQAAQ